MKTYLASSLCLALSAAGTSGEGGASSGTSPATHGATLASIEAFVLQVKSRGVAARHPAEFTIEDVMASLKPMRTVERGKQRSPEEEFNASFNVR